MIRAAIASLVLVLALFAGTASAQLSTYTFATLPGSPSSGQLAWITDNAGTATVGSPASGGAAPGNRDLVSWDATQSRWEFVSRVPSTSPAPAPAPAIDSTLTGYTNTSPGVVDLALANIRGAVDWLIDSIGTERVCSTELVRGVGYNPVTKRYRKTCADYNWHRFQDATQSSASWIETCTAEGVPHASCLRAGDSVYVGYGLHRLAVAAQYTDDGGEVVTLDHRYNDNGAGVLRGTATRAKWPLPFDPEWEARPEFSKLGYPTDLRMIMVNRGVKIVGPGAPDVIEALASDSTVSSNAPKFVGAFIVDDRGPSPNATNAVLDGPGSNIHTSDWYRTLVGWNPNINYCNTTSNSDPTCNNAVDLENFDGPSANEYAYQSPILANFTDTGSSLLCVSDTVGGTSNATYTGLCRGNRMVRCGNAGASSGRNVHGCVFDTNSSGTYGDTVSGVADLDLGVCESFADSMQYDRQTRKQDIQIALALPQCADNAGSATDCELTKTGTGTLGIGWNFTIVDVATPIGSWTGPLGSNGTACGSGGSYIEVGSVAGLGGNYAHPAPRRNYYYSGAPYMTATAVRRDKMDLRGAGFRRMGFAPSSWYGRDVAGAGLGDCLSGATVGNTGGSNDDEAACDSDTQAAFAWGYNGLISESFFYRSNHYSDKSGVVETWPGGGPNFFTDNRIRDVLRGAVSDWGEGLFARNHFNGIGVAEPNAAGYATLAIACYSDNCEIRDNTFERFKTTNFYQLQANSNGVLITGNKYRHGSIAYGSSMYLIRDSAYSLIEGEEYFGLWGAGNNAFIRLQPGWGGIQKPTLIYRKNRGVIANGGAAGGSTTSVLQIENTNADTNRPDDFKEVVMADNVLQSRDSNTCLLWLEDNTTDASAVTRASANRISLLNNALIGPGSPDVICAGGYRATPGTLFDASNDRGISAESILPISIGNKINNVAQPNLTQLFVSEAGLDSDNLADGQIVTVYDGTAGCAHTTGNLTAGSARVTCVAHPNTGSDDGTWGALP